METKYKVHYRADCVGDWFRPVDGEDIADVLFDSPEAAEAAAGSSYRGPDEYGNEAYWDIEPVKS